MRGHFKCEFCRFSGVLNAVFWLNLNSLGFVKIVCGVFTMVILQMLRLRFKPFTIVLKNLLIKSPKIHKFKWLNISNFFWTIQLYLGHLPSHVCLKSDCAISRSRVGEQAICQALIRGYGICGTRPFPLSAHSPGICPPLLSPIYLVSHAQNPKLALYRDTPLNSVLSSISTWFTRLPSFSSFCGVYPPCSLIIQMF